MTINTTTKTITYKSAAIPSAIVRAARSAGVGSDLVEVFGLSGHDFDADMNGGTSTVDLVLRGVAVEAFAASRSARDALKGRGLTNEQFVAAMESVCRAAFRGL
jgi:hypothetical protein